MLLKIAFHGSWTKKKHSLTKSYSVRHLTTLFYFNQIKKEKKETKRNGNSTNKRATFLLP